MTRNEKTSKLVASAAGKMMRGLDREINVLTKLKIDFIDSVDRAIMALKMGRSVAGSALTQAPDKKKPTSRCR